MRRGMDWEWELNNETCGSAGGTENRRWISENPGKFGI